MDISLDLAGTLFLIAGGVGAFLRSYKNQLKMTEDIKTLFVKIKEKDDDIKNLNSKIDNVQSEIKSFRESNSKSMDSMRDAYTDSVENLSKLINSKHIELIKEIAKVGK